jgi:ferric-dicitrate binding protein FerR (iron transport regulator)
MGADRWAEALTWHETLREADEMDVTNALSHEWEHWYADAENQRVFEAVGRLFVDRTLYIRRRRRSREELEADQYDPSIPVAEWRKRHSPRVIRKQRAPVVNRRWRRSSGGLAGATVATAIAVLVILWLPRFWSAARPLTAPVVYETNAGELRAVHLSDGSSIILGGRTELSVGFSSERRFVKLIAGQAWFKVAHDPHWLFVVAAGDGTITDVGTAFLVTRDSDQVVVTVTEGTVEVTTRKAMALLRVSGQAFGRAPILAPIRVTRGQELAFSDDGALTPVKQADTRAATAWTHGRLIFDDQPLRYVIETVDLYSSRHIAVSPSAGGLRFSGIVLDNEIDDWLQGLARIFPVTVEERGAGVCVHLRDSKPVRGWFDSSCTK